ncbi:hypothetical protein A2716_05150 [candidate division WWE3 bacterium RIFCSPHIGHO2_01_FULL_40_23]|uniref:BioF2-like acetyltransferase domain-containing protein n=1 Tax=candidate division WWE3 bacterium RIFCSPLOWO2_01_FULL_41_18 TaxID=1802625 RepID=A0A1F4VDM4_UNCKA|nr:MAG: hypothetical protein A2716_05150 [candidate division WWE3 bacterium RIFCSPHIGHO2_01_FULL_40_23]OGC55257.1 MAG: hypothetical protein A3A78_04760 [candidate division WWE3 bacterium RIFCSPLOWO2_01_FULL_41_18]
MTERSRHIVQSQEWGEIKTKYGTKAAKAGSVQFTKHRIPFTSYFYGYSPKVNPKEINFKILEEILLKENVIAINFDCPNVTTDEEDFKENEDILKKACTPSKRNTFSKYNILFDIIPTEDVLLSNMHPKTRYNIKYAEKNGIKVREGGDKDITLFNKLQNETAKRQKFYIHPDRYYGLIWEVLSKKGMAKLLVAEYQGKPVSCWMLFLYKGVLYYPYGAWSGEHQNLFPNNLLCFEAIKQGKKEGCKTFDMWGASKDPENKNDPWYGFTKFKLGFGGKHVEYINSYDFVLNQPLYQSFNLINGVRWAVLKMLKG